MTVLTVACAVDADDVAVAIASVAAATLTVGATVEMIVFSWLVAVIAYRVASTAFFAVFAALKPSAAISALVHELAAAHIVRPALTTPTMMTFEAMLKSAAAAAAAACAPAAKLTACWAASAAAVTVALELSEGLTLIRSDKLDAAVETEAFAVWLCVDARLAWDAVATLAC